MRQLLDFAQLMLSAPFDTARPLWETYLVEGITEGDAPAAVLMKTHHAVTDGVGGVELMRQLYDFDRDADRGPMPAFRRRRMSRAATWPAEPPGGRRSRPCRGVVSLANQGVRLGGRVAQRPGHGTEAAHQDGRLGAACARPASRASVAAVASPRPGSAAGDVGVPPRPLPPGGQVGRRLGQRRLHQCHRGRLAPLSRGPRSDGRLCAVGDAGQPAQGRRPGRRQPLRRRAHRRAGGRARPGAQDPASPRERGQRRRRTGDQRCSTPWPRCSSRTADNGARVAVGDR